MKQTKNTSQDDPQNIALPDKKLVKHALVSFADAQFVPPGKREFMTRDTLLGKPDDDFTDKPDVVVFCERKSGEEHFLDWLKLVLEEPMVIVHRSFSDLAPLNDFPEQSLAKLRNIEESEDTPLIEKQILSANSDIRSSPLHIPRAYVVSHGLEKAQEAAYVAALRKIQENACSRKENINLRFICLSNNLKPFLSSSTNSSYMDFAHPYCIARLTREETNAVIKDSLNLASLSQVAELDHATLGKIMQETGGHPYLLKALIYHLNAMKLPRRRERWPNTIKQAVRKIKEAPPDGVNLWLRQLRELMKEHPELRRTMENYVSGQTLGRTRLPPPSKERHLFVAGWLALNEEDRWGISSNMHAAFARQLLASRGE